jgi:hypothetical protein
MYLCLILAAPSIWATSRHWVYMKYILKKTNVFQGNENVSHLGALYSAFNIFSLCIVVINKPTNEVHNLRVVMNGVS